MTLRIADRILETSTTTGTGALTLAAAVTGYQRFSAIPSIVNGDTLYYCIVAVDANGNPSGDWEVGLGTYSSANTLTRTTPAASSNAGAAVNFAAGTKHVLLDATAGYLGLAYTPGGTDVALADGGTGASLVDPNADRILFWDDSAGQVTWLTPGTGIAISGTSITATGGSGLSAIFEDQKPANTAGGTSTSGFWFGRILNTEVFDDIGLSLRSGTFTVTIATPGVVTFTGHGLTANSVFVPTTSGALPTGMAAGTTYYVSATGLTANTFQFAAAPNGASINTTGSQSGTHTASTGTISLDAGTYEVDATAAYFTTNAVRNRLRDLTNGVTLALSESAYTSNSNGGSGSPRILGRFTLAGTVIIQLEGRVTLGTATNGLGVLSNFGEVEVYSRLKLTRIA